MGRPRLKLRFKEPDAMVAALATESDPPGLAVVNEKRSYLAISEELVRLPSSRGGRAVGSVIDGLDDVDASTAFLSDDPSDTSHVEVDPGELLHELQSVTDAYDQMIVQYEAELVPDLQYDVEIGAAPEGTISEQDLVGELGRMRTRVGADSIDPGAGEGITIAIVDTGVDPIVAQIEAARRGDGWAPPNNDPWVDDKGHGSRTARIACGADGFAARAKVHPCRTRFFDSELAGIYDHLLGEVLPNLPAPLVINNSFGIRTGRPPGRDRYGDFDAVLVEALAADDVLVVFSAGNYHRYVTAPKDCEPTSIWTFKCYADALVVGASDFEGQIHDFSSRGPGQFHGEQGSRPKPDLCAPVPGPAWGTSAAAPQVSGTAAVLFGLQPSLTAVDARQRIVDSAQTMGLAPACQGAGELRVAAALA